MFVLLNAPVDDLELAGLKISPVDMEDAATQYDMVWHMWEKGEQLAGMVHYSTDLFDASTIDRILGHFQRLLEGIITSPEQRLSPITGGVE
jgi:non-ribosomal peptide synthetase component F